MARHGTLTFSRYCLEDWAEIREQWERFVNFDPYENEWEW